jgi:DMSO/TMAO reductase YedYZ molybdopterin-dependent catalytic subunit
MPPLSDQLKRELSKAVVNMMGDGPPDYSEASWILTIDGLVKNPLEFRWPELIHLPFDERKVPLF